MLKHKMTVLLTVLSVTGAALVGSIGTVSAKSQLEQGREGVQEMNKAASDQGFTTDNTGANDNAGSTNFDTSKANSLVLPGASSTSTDESDTKTTAAKNTYDKSKTVKNPNTGDLAPQTDTTGNDKSVATQNVKTKKVSGIETYGKAASVNGHSKYSKIPQTSTQDEGLFTRLAHSILAWF